MSCSSRRGPGRAMTALTGDDMVHAIRSLRVVLHGLVTLETAGGFGLPQSVDETRTRLIDGLHLSFHELRGGQTAAGKLRCQRLRHSGAGSSGLGCRRGMGSEYQVS
ncbi:MAG: TetR-like C-terminal domain-containing protein [Mycobacteriaceae bacterium]